MPDPRDAIADDIFVLVTIFGTVLSIDAITGQAIHGLPEHDDTEMRPVRLRKPVAGSNLMGRLLCEMTDAAETWRFAPARRARYLSLTDGAAFATAEPIGTVTMLATEPRDFESFLPVARRDLAFLRDMLGRTWRAGGKPASRLGFARGAILLNEDIFDLGANLPFEPRCTRERLVLRGNGREIVAERAETVAAAPVIWIRPLGNIGNRALQYLTAAGIREHMPEAEIRNVKLGMWGMEAPAPRPQAGRSAGAGRQRLGVDVAGVASCLRRGVIDAFLIEAFTFRVDHYPSRARCRELLPALPGASEVTRFGPDTLLCSIRGREILRAVHRNYFPLPPAYYERLRQESGLRLVFFGQLGDDPYTRSLRQAFPEADFIAGHGEAHDFETIRRSCNVALPISTFAWLAAWLGHAERIYLPVGGMFSPVTQPAQLYIPYGDPSYRYVLLPPAEAQDVFGDSERFFRMQAYLAHHARFVDEHELREIHARVGTFGRHAPVQVGAFDTEAYLRSNLDAAIENRALKRTALAHYLEVGAAQGRKPLRFDGLFYGERYPDAADAVARGLHSSLLAYYLAVGVDRGDLPHAACVTPHPPGSGG